MYNNNNNLYFFYRNSDGENIILFNNTEYLFQNFTNEQISKHSILVIIDLCLFQEGKNFYLVMNFQQMIFLPSLLSNYHSLLEKFNKKYLLLQIEKSSGNLVIMRNSNYYLIYHDVAVQQLEEAIQLPVEIFYNSKSQYYTLPIYFIEILRKRESYISKLNVILLLIIILLNILYCFKKTR